MRLRVAGLEVPDTDAGEARELEDFRLRQLGERISQRRQSLETLAGASDSQETDFHDFNPMPYQREWFDSDRPLKLILAGNRVGKTTCLAIKLRMVATGESPIAFGGGAKPIRRGTRILIAGESLKSLKETLIPKLQQYLPDDLFIRKPNWTAAVDIPTLYFKSGAKLVIGAYSQLSSRLEGGVWDFIGMDEPPPKPFYTSVARGTIDHEGEIWVTATPLKEAWMQDDLIEPSQNPDSELFEFADYFQVGIHSNCAGGDGCPGNGGYLPHRRIVQFLATLPEEERAAREHGVFLKLQGLEYHYVRKETHVIPDFEIPADWPVVEVHDPATKRGSWIIWACCSNEDMWTIFQAAHIPNGSFDTMAQQIHAYRACCPSPVRLAIMDQAAGGFISNHDMAENWFDEFRKRGLRYVPSLRESLHETLHGWLKVMRTIDGKAIRPKLVMTERVAGMTKGPLWATERFRWEPDASRRIKYEQPGKDWVDVMRYLASHPGLTFRRLSAMAPEAHTSQRPLNRTYATRRAYQAPNSAAQAIQRQARMVLKPKTRKTLRRRGWSF